MTFDNAHYEIVEGKIMIESLIKPVSNIVGKLVKDKDLQAKLDHELATLFHQANLAQIEVNKIELKVNLFKETGDLLLVG